MKFRSVVSTIGKPRNVRESLANRSTRWISEKFGVSLRQAQRYKSGKAPLTRPQDREKRERVMGSANAETRRVVAGNALRDAQRLHIGAVQVQGSGDPKPTTRRINKDWAITPAMRDHLDRAADLLDRGDVDGAEREMNAAVMNRYAGETERGGRDAGGGIASWLTITDWGAGFDVS